MSLQMIICFYNDMDNHVSMGGEGHAEVKDQAMKFIPLSNGEIDATKKDQLYAEILQRGIKEKILLLRSLSKNC